MRLACCQKRAPGWGEPKPVHFERRLACCLKRKGLLDGGRITSYHNRHYYSPVGSCHGDRMSRQKFRLLTSWELSKRKKKKTFWCQDSREMFVDFLLHIDYFQLGFEANFLI